MTRKNKMLISVLIAIVLIPQLLFWWLAPAGAVSRMMVYIFGSLLTLALPLVCLIAYWQSNIRRTAGLLVVSCCLEFAVVILSAFLLGFNISVRSTIFAYVIATLICFIILSLLIDSALRPQTIGIHGSRNLMEAVQSTEQDFQEQVRQTGSSQSHRTERIHLLDRNASIKPMPPRNR